MIKAQTIIAALSMMLLALVAGLVYSIKSQVELVRQIQGGTSAILGQVHQELSKSPVEDLLNIRPKTCSRRAPVRERAVRAITLSNGEVIRPVINPGLTGPDAPISDLNHWSCSFFSVGVAVLHGHIVTNTSGYVTGWVEDDVHLYPYEAIKNVEFETVE